MAAAAAAELLSRSLDHVSRERLTAHTREFARWTKHAGTPGELKSLAYVERALASYGYRTELIRHDAYISLPGAARLDLDGFSPACITHSFSRPTPPGGLELPLVGADGDPRGAAVLVDGIATPGAAAAFATSGAAAQIHISPDEHLHEMCVSPVWGSPGDDRLGDLPQTVVLTVARADGERLRAAAVSGTARVRVVADVDTAWRPTPILVAELAGPDEPFVLFSGHHDTWYVGAMDNGGANATMLEVARVSALERAHWRRGLRLAFWSGHSQGRYSSSAWYADHHWEELEARAVAHVNVDSTGGCGNTVVANATASAELGALAREAIAAQAGQEFAGDRMHRAGDQSFWGIGVPAIFGNMGEQPSEAGVRSPGTGWWWHTPDDTLDKIDSDLLLRDTRIYQHVVWRLLADPVPPLDYAESARQLARTLDERAQAAGSQLDLAPMQARVRELEERAAWFGEVVTAVAADRSAAAAECLRRVSRAIVPVDHTSGDRFAHDPALAQGPLPALAGIDRLGSLDPAGDDARFLTSRLVRECNRVSVALRDAVAAFDAFLAA